MHFSIKADLVVYDMLSFTRFIISFLSLKLILNAFPFVLREQIFGKLSVRKMITAICHCDGLLRIK